MPIVWRLTFEEPLIKQIQAGKIGNSKQLVRAIVLQYDLCIRQGLAGGPGTAAGPFLTGKSFVLERALLNYFRIRSIKQKALTATIYLGVLKSIYSQLKDASKQITTFKRDLGKITTEQKKVQREILATSKRKNDIEARRKLASLKTKSNSLKAKQLETLSKIDVVRSEINDTIKPKISEVRRQLQQLVTRITVPALQDTKLKTFKQIPKRVKDLIKEFREIRKELQTQIKDNVKNINNTSKTFKQLRSNLTPQQASVAKYNINTIIKSTDPQAGIRASKSLMKIVDSYPDTKIPTEIKNNCRNALGKILENKNDILNKKDEIKNVLVSKLKERTTTLISTFKPNFLPGPSKIQEVLKDRKQIQNIINEVRVNVKNVNSSIKNVKLANQEYKRILSAISQRKPSFKPSSSLVNSLNNLNSGLGDKYNQIKTTREARTFILILLTQFIAEKLNFTDKLNTVKKQYLKEYKDLILKKRINPEERIFNAFLRIGLLGYWSGGVWGIGTVANVIFPGTVTLPVQMKSTANPANFIRSLSRTMQLHLKTINGTITFPGTPPVVSPWVTYF